MTPCGSRIFMRLAVGFVVCFSVVTVVYTSLRQAATVARDEMLGYENDNPANWPDWFKEVHRDGCFKRLREMEFWPLAWPDLNVLLALLVTGLLAILFFRISIVFVALVFAIFVYHALRSVLGFAR